MTGPEEARKAVEATARAAAAAWPSLVAASERQVDEALERIAALLGSEAKAILDANAADVEEARGRLSTGLLDRLTLTEERLASVAVQARAMAGLPPVPRVVERRTLAGGLHVEERKVPVGVIGAIYEARPNVTVDMAVQLLKSRNAGVLRTGGASLRTAAAIVDAAIAPALAAAGVEPGTIGLVRAGGHEGAEALVSLPRLVPLVIIRGSGETTRHLAGVAAGHGVRTLQHADGGGVLYVHRSADPEKALFLLTASLDKLGVCNRVNWLLVDRRIWDGFLPRALAALEGLGVRASLPPYDHPFSREWALDARLDATVTVATVDGVEEALQVAHRDTSGLAACIVAEDGEAARTFLDGYRGTGGFWNATTRFLDGYELTGAPETGINVDHVPGPRGPVTYRDLCLRQFVVVGDGTQRR